MPAGTRSRLTSRNSSLSRDAYSRSPSRSPSQGSRYSDESARYSDESFYSDEEKMKNRKSGGDKQSIKRNNDKSKVVNGRSSKNSVKGPNKNDTKDAQHYVVRRMLSARRIKINELKNEIESVSQHHNEIQTENKLLKRQLAMQNRALNKYEDSESDISTVMSRHSNEVRVLKEQNRKYKDKLSHTEKSLQNTDAELKKTQNQLKKVKQINEEKGLSDRHELMQKLNNAENELEDKSKKVNELTRHVENLQKNHKHQYGIEQARYRAAQKTIKDLTEELDNVKQNMREKEKELEVRNIYYNRVIKPPHKLSSRKNTPSLRERRFSEASSRADDFQDSDLMKENNLNEDFYITQNPDESTKVASNEEVSEKLKLEKNRLEKEMEISTKKHIEEERERIRIEDMKKVELLKQQEELKKQEEFKKQAELKRLEDLRQQEEMERKNREEKEKVEMEAADQEKKRQRDILRAKMKNMEANSNNEMSKHNTQNLSKPASKQKDEDLVFGSYAPTMRNTNQNRRLNKKPSIQENDFPENTEITKKASLLDDLFGANDSKKDIDKNDNYESNTRTNKENSFTRADSFNSERVDSGKVLSRRPRNNNNVLNTRTLVNSLNDFDDGIEELAI